MKEDEDGDEVKLSMCIYDSSLAVYIFGEVEIKWKPVALLLITPCKCRDYGLCSDAKVVISDQNSEASIFP
jgi:hypothetical protein